MAALTINYGALAPEIEKQLKKQGLTLGSKAEQAEKLRRAITYLMFADILTDGQKNKAFERLHKWVAKHSLTLREGD